MSKKFVHNGIYTRLNRQFFCVFKALTAWELFLIVVTGLFWPRVLYYKTVFLFLLGMKPNKTNIESAKTHI